MGYKTRNPVAVSSRLEPSRVRDLQTCSPRFGRPGTGRAAAGLHFGLRASVSGPQYGNRAPEDYSRFPDAVLGKSAFRTYSSRISHKDVETLERHREVFQDLRPSLTYVGIGRIAEQITRYSIHAID